MIRVLNELQNMILLLQKLFNPFHLLCIVVIPMNVARAARTQLIHAVLPVQNEEMTVSLQSLQPPQPDAGPQGPPNFAESPNASSGTIRQLEIPQSTELAARTAARTCPAAELVLPAHHSGPGRPRRAALRNLR